MQKQDPERRTTAVIVGAGEFAAEAFKERVLKDGNMIQETLLIAADGGLRYLQECGLTPDVILGDFDSLGYVPDYTNTRVITLPVEKDVTDTEAALSYAWERSCRRILLFGMSGDRPDHFLANLQLMAAYSRRGSEMLLAAPTFMVYALAGNKQGPTTCAGTTAGQPASVSAPTSCQGPAHLTLHGRAGCIFSIFTLQAEARGVTISGDAKYRLEKATLSNENSLGVSNAFTGPEVSIEVKEGTLLVFQYTT